nr:hypothetical protein [Tanacetum cinerariifolium]
VLGDGEACQRCTCKRCGSGLSKGLCYICGNNQNSLNDSPSISVNSLHNPPQIDERCYECGDALDGIFCQRCTCKSCRKGAHIGYNCPPKVPIISNPEPCNQTMNNELPQTLPSFDPMCYSEKENSSPCISKPNFVDESSNIFNPPPQPPIYSGNVEDKILVPKPPKNYARCARCGYPVDGPYCQGCTFLRKKLEEDLLHISKASKTLPSHSMIVPTLSMLLESHSLLNRAMEVSYTRSFVILTKLPTHPIFTHFRPTNFIAFTKKKWIEEEQADNAQYWKIPACCDDDDDYNSVITPVLSTEEPDNSLSMGDEHLDTIPATESDEVINSSVEDLVPIPSESEVMTTLFTMNIEYVESSPHDSELVSLEMVEIVIPKDEEIKDDNLRENLLNVRLLIANIEALKDNPNPSSKFLTKSSSTSPNSFLEENNTFHNSLPEFENFRFDLEEISSGSTTTHSDISLSEYDSFIFDLSNDQFPPTNRSDFTHEEFANELAHIISPPKYDCFYFRNLPDIGELISILNSGIRENFFTTRVNLPVEDDYSLILAYVVWIFLAYLTYLVIPPYIHSFGNEDTIFDPSITINHFCSFKPGLSHRCGTFKKFNTHRSHLNESLMEILFSTCSLMDQ